MGSDKGTIAYHDKPHAAYLSELISPYCERVFVSVSARQAACAPYDGMAVIVDTGPRRGPATGLLVAHDAEPQAAWLVVAVDLALLDEATLATFVAERNPNAAATAFHHADGTLEPLCAIWEPTACAALAERVAAGDASPRRCLEALDVEILTCREPNALRSIDSPADRDAVLRKLQRSP